jgi:hypothetical protein
MYFTRGKEGGIAERGLLILVIRPRMIKRSVLKESDSNAPSTCATRGTRAPRGTFALSEVFVALLVAQLQTNATAVLVTGVLH